MSKFLPDRDVLENAAMAVGHEVYSYVVGEGVNIDGDFRNPKIFNPLENVHDLYMLECKLGIWTAWLEEPYNMVVCHRRGSSEIKEPFAQHNGDRQKAKAYAITKMAAMIYLESKTVGVSA